MKKLISLLTLSMVIALTSNCATIAQTPDAAPSQRVQKQEQMKKQFEQRLKLTDKQKEQAKAIHLKGREQIKPIITQIKEKKQEIDAVKLSKIAPQAQQEKINGLRNELRELEKKAHEIRKENNREFESILTKKQQKELAKMKAEGRAKFEKHHPAHPMQNLRPNGFFEPKPLFQQPKPAEPETK